MKSKSIIAAALAGVFASSAFAVTTVAPSKFEAPSPSKVVAPVMLPRQHSGSDVTLTMNIDAQGKPSNVRVLGATNQSAYRHIIATVSKWEFTPARKDGQAISSKVELPLEVKGL